MPTGDLQEVRCRMIPAKTLATAGLMLLSYLLLAPAWINPSWAISSGADPSCVKVELDKALSLVPTPDSLGKLGLAKNREIVRNPIRDQGPEEICWAFTECGLAEAEFIKAHPGASVHISPEFQNFYHIYRQIQSHKGYFRKKIAQIAKLSGEKKQKAIKEASEEAYSLLTMNPRESQLPGKKPKDWVPDQGNEEVYSLQESTKFGMVPVVVFNGYRRTTKKEELYEKAIKRFVTQNLLDPNKLDSLEGPLASDGISDRLFSQLSNKLKPYLGGIPPRPNDKFFYKGEEFTPITFMRDHVGFNPEQWHAMVSSRDNHELALESMREAMSRGHEVPIGFDTYDDPVPGTKLTSFTMAEKSGVFSPAYCENGVCVKADGGHEVRAVNWYEKDGPDGKKITALVVQNSWGYKGRASDGTKTKKPNERGFYIITSDYLLQNFKHGGAWDFVLPQEVADLPQFAALKKEKR